MHSVGGHIAMPCWKAFLRCNATASVSKSVLSVLFKSASIVIRDLSSMIPVGYGDVDMDISFFLGLEFCVVGFWIHDVFDPFCCICVFVENKTEGV